MEAHHHLTRTALRTLGPITAFSALPDAPVLPDVPSRRTQRRLRGRMGR